VAERECSSGVGVRFFAALLPVSVAAASFEARMSDWMEMNWSMATSESWPVGCANSSSPLWRC
jgi:hypothetical protein